MYNLGYEHFQMVEPIRMVDRWMSKFDVDTIYSADS